MTTLSEFTAAAADTDLRDRLIAAAQEAGVPDASYWVDANRGEITRTNVGDPGNKDATVASVYAYAYGEYYRTMPKKPGANPGAVTDDHIRHAVSEVLKKSQPKDPAEVPTN